MRDPDKLGPVSRAWEWQLVDDEDPNNAAHVATWFIHGPYHPFWSWWLVLAVDLIDRPGQPAPHLQYPGAEFEVLILSVDPKWDPDVEAKPGAVPYLTPPDLCYQFDGMPREKAAEVVGLMVEAIVQGQMSPDSDYRGAWRTALDETVAHYRAGAH